MWKETHWKDGPDSLTDMSPERSITRNIWKMFLTVESGKYKLNQTPLHTYNGQTPGWHQQMLVRMWTRKDSPTRSPLLLGTQNSKLLQKSLAVSYPTKHTFINKSNNWLLEFPQRSGKLAPAKLCNCSDQLYPQLPKFERNRFTLQSASGSTVVNPDRRKLFSCKMEIRIYQRCMLLRGKCQCEKVTNHMGPTPTF